MGDYIAPQQGYTRPSNPFAIAGFVCALCGLVPYLGLLSAIAGIVLSSIGMKKANETGIGRGLSIAGLVIGIVLSVPALITLLFVFTVR